MKRNKGIIIIFFLSIGLFGFSLEASADSKFDSLLMEKGYLAKSAWYQWKVLITQNIFYNWWT
ncbi:hypothetical protein [Niallia circulans]|uniref:Uncharacterized protein n=1 Tax=Niallia circulans TaxID=1397 RepID=A0A941JHN0_NIACI|nr:hypothetical protein [Niallia circulans]MCB5237659.1 hypothetical protein [Niallia circulans]